MLHPQVAPLTSADLVVAARYTHPSAAVVEATTALESSDAQAKIKAVVDEAGTDAMQLMMVPSSNPRQHLDGIAKQ